MPSTVMILYCEREKRRGEIKKKEQGWRKGCSVLHGQRMSTVCRYMTWYTLKCVSCCICPCTVATILFIFLNQLMLSLSFFLIIFYVITQISSMCKLLYSMIREQATKILRASHFWGVGNSETHAHVACSAVQWDCKATNWCEADFNFFKLQRWNEALTKHNNEKVISLFSIFLSPEGSAIACPFPKWSTIIFSMKHLLVFRLFKKKKDIKNILCYLFCDAPAGDNIFNIPG